MTAKDASIDARDWSLLGVLSVLWGGSFFFNGVVLKELPPFTLVFLRVSDVLRGLFDAPIGAQLLLGVAGGLLAFGLLALVPIPPLDGFGLLWSAQRVPGSRRRE